MVSGANLLCKHLSGHGLEARGPARSRPARSCDPCAREGATAYLAAWTPAFQEWTPARAHCSHDPCAPTSPVSPCAPRQRARAKQSLRRSLSRSNPSPLTSVVSFETAQIVRARSGIYLIYVYARNIRCMDISCIR